MTSTSEARIPITPQLVIGIFITLIGILLTLDRLHILDAAYSLRLWPAVLVVLGAWLVSQRHDAKSRFWGSIWILVGAWLLLNTIGLINVGFWELVWPIAFIWLGVSLIRQTLGRGSRSGTNPGEAGGPIEWIQGRFRPRTDASGTVALFAVMGESKRSISGQSFRGGEMTAIMGGCFLDLRQATMAPGEQATIDVFALMAGHEIWVPTGWTVVSHVLPFMGAVDDKRLPPAEGAAPPRPDARPQLTLRGFVMMGGLIIKS
jgi:hypothetical protein